MMKIFGGGVALSFLLCVPPWPFLNRHPLTWLVKGEDGAPVEGGRAGGGKAGERGARSGGGGSGSKPRSGGKGAKRHAHARAVR
jgi:hypothetical protein